MTEALINYHQRASALEQSARRLLNSGTNNALTPAEMDLLMATDAFMLAREDLAAEMAPAVVVEAEVEAVVAFEVGDLPHPIDVIHEMIGEAPERPGFEVTP